MNGEVRAGKVGTGHDVTALYQVVVDPTADCATGCEVGSVPLGWKDPTV